MAQAYYLTKEKRLLACGLGCALLMQYEHSKETYESEVVGSPLGNAKTTSVSRFCKQFRARTERRRWRKFSQLFPVSTIRYSKHTWRNRRMRCCISVGCLVGANETYLYVTSPIPACSRKQTSSKTISYEFLLKNFGKNMFCVVGNKRNGKEKTLWRVSRLLDRKRSKRWSKAQLTRRVIHNVWKRSEKCARHSWNRQETGT